MVLASTLGSLREILKLPAQRSDSRFQLGFPQRELDINLLLSIGPRRPGLNGEGDAQLASRSRSDYLKTQVRLDETAVRLRLGTAATASSQSASCVTS